MRRLIWIALPFALLGRGPVPFTSLATKQPANQHFGFTEIMSSPKIKNISLFPKWKSGLYPLHPVPIRGASAVVTNEGRVAVDVEVP
jgi:hypothetical protein